MTGFVTVAARDAFTLRRHRALAEMRSAEIPPRRADALLLATWNLREFYTPGYGVRSDECLGYLARILSRFELVALQEVQQDLSALDRLLRLLGPHWAVSTPR